MPSDLSPTTCYSWGQASTLVIERRRPRLGEGMFRYYLALEDFVRKQRVCEQALEIAAATLSRITTHAKV